jgi:hypothetical protein
MLFLPGEGSSANVRKFREGLFISRYGVQMAKVHPSLLRSTVSYWKELLDVFE